MKNIWKIAASLLAVLLIIAGCGKGKDEQSPFYVNVFSVSEDKVLSEITDDVVLEELSNWINTVVIENDVPENLDIESLKPEYIISTYKQPVAVINDGVDQQIDELIIYRESNVIKYQIENSVVKNLSGNLESYQQVTDEAMQTLLKIVNITE